MIDYLQKILAARVHDVEKGTPLHLEACAKFTFVHPFDDPDVIAGQRTIAMGEPVRMTGAGPAQSLASACSRSACRSAKSSMPSERRM